ncbi:MAG: hypothetical protein RLZZ142_1339, partial [Verrucomicrobiota bacterium]
MPETANQAQSEAQSEAREGRAKPTRREKGEGNIDGGDSLEDFGRGVQIGFRGAPQDWGWGICLECRRDAGALGPGRKGTKRGLQSESEKLRFFLEHSR